MNSPHRGWTKPRHLPHADFPTPHAITYRLRDSLPVDCVPRLRKRLACAPEDDRQRLLRKAIEQRLDRGLGSCLLARAKVAATVLESWRHFDGQRYELLAWVIMPNHVHVLIRPSGTHALGRIVQDWKSYTTRHTHERLAGPRHLWQRDYWDRYIRDESHYHATVAYIENNPVAAGLVDRPGAWPWSSAAAAAVSR